LAARATAMLARAYLLATGRLTFIGVGGIANGRQALTRIKAGASLVQIYTAFAYRGPALVSQINRDLAAALREEGFSRLAEAIGADAVRLARG
jgi:dihydroorotate dehydrogenase